MIIKKYYYLLSILLPKQANNMSGNKAHKLVLFVFFFVFRGPPQEGPRVIQFKETTYIHSTVM
jgi:hypothetical protein